MSTTSDPTSDPASDPTSDQAAATSRPRLRQHLSLAVGAVALVTLGAFENRAVGTALPTMVRELDAVAAFGPANAAPTASYLAALALAGSWADRKGPLPVLRTGIVLFAVAQLLVGLAVSMPMVILGRTVSGVAEAALDMSLTVLVARALPPTLRPRMFSLFAAAWVLPSVVGPAATGVLTELVGWRWVFLGALVLLGPVWLLLRGAVRTAGCSAPAASRRAGPQATPSTAGWAASCGAFVFVLTLAGSQLGDHRRSAVLVLVAAAAALTVSAIRLLPRGTLVARHGFPAVVAVRALVGGAFGSVGGFLPLLMTDVHRVGAALAGVSLSITGVAWAAGSWLQGRDHHWPRPAVLRAGLLLMTVGLTGTLLLVAPGVSLWCGLAAWGLAGLGIGLVSPTVQLLTLDLSADDEQGRNSGHVQAAISISLALAFAFGGTVVGLAAPTPGRAAFAVVLASAALMALVALLASARVVAPDPRG